VAQAQSQNLLQQAKLELDQVSAALKDSRQQLAAVQDELRKQTLELEHQVDTFDRGLQLAQDKKQAEFNVAATKLNEKIDQLKKDKAYIEDCITALKSQILALSSEEEQVHQNLLFNTRTHEEKVKSLRLQAENLDALITDKRTRLGELTVKTDDQKAKLVRIEQKVVQTEQGYISRIEILQRRQKEAEDECEQTLVKLQEYTESLGHVSAEEIARQEELETREKDLIAKIRALNEERIDLAAQKRRFEQTKQLR
jgi:chromosome segregation ATPase